MPVLRPDDTLGLIRSDAPALDRQLKHGDGMGWPGDPRLELRQGIIEAQNLCQHPVTGKWLRKGDIVARRWEVWRHCEDGVDRRLGAWRLEEFDRIILDMSGMRLDAPGHVPVEEAIDKANAKKDAEVSSQMRDSLGPMLDHAARIVHDTTQPKNVFRQMPGLRDEPKATDAGE